MPAIPAGFNLIVLPFADDIRPVEGNLMEHAVRLEKEHTLTLANVIEGLKLSRYMESIPLNPGRHYGYTRAWF